MQTARVIRTVAVAEGWGYGVRSGLSRPAPDPFARAAEPGTRHQPKDRGEVAQTRDGRGYKDEVDPTALNGADRSRGSGGLSIPASHAASAGRLPLCHAAICPASGAVCAASLPAAPGISRLPDVEGDKPECRKFKHYPIGCFHIDIAEVQTTAEGKLYLFVGIDRTSKFAVAQLVATADRKTAGEFLQHMLEAVPYQVHTVLTDNGIQFAEQRRNATPSIPGRCASTSCARQMDSKIEFPHVSWTLSSLISRQGDLEPSRQLT